MRLLIFIRVLQCTSLLPFKYDVLLARLVDGVESLLIGITRCDLQRRRIFFFNLDYHQKPPSPITDT